MAKEKPKDPSKKKKGLTAAKAVTSVGKSFTYRYQKDQIFRREMGEPEFFQYKKDLHPIRPILTQKEEQEISRKALIPKDLTPPYKPEYVLSPEFGGISNYEQGIETVRGELEQKLQRLRTEPDTNQQAIQLAEEDLKTLDYLIENYHMGMNVFRTAKGGRKGLRE